MGLRLTAWAERETTVGLGLAFAESRIIDQSFSGIGHPTGSMIAGSSFFGELTRVLMRQAFIRCAG